MGLHLVPFASEYSEGRDLRAGGNERGQRWEGEGGGAGEEGFGGG